MKKLRSKLHLSFTFTLKKVAKTVPSETGVLELEYVLRRRRDGTYAVIIKENNKGERASAALGRDRKAAFEIFELLWRGTVTPFGLADVMSDLCPSV